MEASPRTRPVQCARAAVSVKSGVLAEGVRAAYHHGAADRAATIFA